jgi:hypothetical protein
MKYITQNLAVYPIHCLTWHSQKWRIVTTAATVTESTVLFSYGTLANTYFAANISGFLARVCH